MARATVTVLAALALAAPAAAAPSVLHVGDSLAVGSDPPLRALLPRWSFTTDALKSRPTAAGVAIIDRRLSLPRALVVELGTNDSPDATQAFDAAVRHVLVLAGPYRCVVWVNVHRAPYNGVSYAGFNRVLAAEQDAAPNLAVVDWDATVRSGEVEMADDVHPTPLGYQARAAAIARALKDCLQRPAAPRAVGRAHTLKVAAKPRRRARRQPRPEPAAAPIRVYTPRAAAHRAAAAGGTSPWLYAGLGALAALLAAGGAWRLRGRRS